MKNLDSMNLTELTEENSMEITGGSHPIATRNMWGILWYFTSQDTGLNVTKGEWT